MPSTIIDSAIFGNMFSTEPMRAVWSDENRTRQYLDFEAALARVQGAARHHPAGGGRRDRRRLRHRARSTWRSCAPRPSASAIPVLGVVSQINALCRDGLGEYCHWGATTQDITDTATVLQIREALALVEDDLTAISAALATLARRYRDTPMVGRSNLQQAVPVTFGYKMAGLLSAIERHRERLAQLRPRVLMGEFAGAAGTLASIETRCDGDAGRADAGARPRPAGHRLAHDARHHRRSRLLPRPGRRHARQTRPWTSS